MIIRMNLKLIPGTVLDRRKMGDVTGLAFLRKIFYITDGIMLSQIRAISGIDGSTLQNWTKRGWVESPKNKRYDIDQLAHILIINMLRSCMQLDGIAFLIKYINGRAGEPGDDIVRYSELYDYICRIFDMVEHKEDTSTLGECIEEITSGYEEKVSGARKRLCTALEIIITAYYASLVKKKADDMLYGIMKKTGRI
ncbi:MAG TPA: DUF1836 domain-containing protein [Clostridiales bacterium]|nr:DUF1836 domain-containing protein [Clostridiales bacterium]